MSDIDLLAEQFSERQLERSYNWIIRLAQLNLWFHPAMMLGYTTQIGFYNDADLGYYAGSVFWGGFLWGIFLFLFKTSPSTVSLLWVPFYMTGLITWLLSGSAFYEIIEDEEGTDEDK